MKKSARRQESGDTVQNSKSREESKVPVPASKTKRVAFKEEQDEHVIDAHDVSMEEPASLSIIPSRSIPSQ